MGIVESCGGNGDAHLSLSRDSPNASKLSVQRH